MADEKDTSETPPANPKDKGGTPDKGNDTPTSADIVKLTPAVKKLETKVSALEDENATLKTRNGELEKEFEKLKNVPSKTLPGKNLWDEVNEFLGL